MKTALYIIGFLVLCYTFGRFILDPILTPLCKWIDENNHLPTVIFILGIMLALIAFWAKCK